MALASLEQRIKAGAACRLKAGIDAGRLVDGFRVPHAFGDARGAP